jgi:large subunit ribosomal protein L24
MSKINKGDQVIVLTGRDKGRKGVVQSRLDDEKLIIDGVNVYRKNVKPNPLKGTPGGFTEKTMPIHQSNVAIFNAEENRADRVGFKFLEGKKVRVYKSTGKEIKA